MCGMALGFLVIQISKDFDCYRELNTATRMGDALIILAGDYSDIEFVMETRPEIKKLFKHTFDFGSWEERDCVDLFERRARREGFLIRQGVRERVADECLKCRIRHSCDKGHDVDLLWELVKRRRALRVYETPETNRTIQSCDDHRALRLQEALGPKTKSEISDDHVALRRQEAQNPDTKRTIQCGDMDVFDSMF
jgi:hypothetical protein